MRSALRCGIMSLPARACPRGAQKSRLTFLPSSSLTEPVLQQASQGGKCGQENEIPDAMVASTAGRLERKRKACAALRPDAPERHSSHAYTRPRSGALHTFLEAPGSEPASPGGQPQSLARTRLQQGASASRPRRVSVVTGMHELMLSGVFLGRQIEYRGASGEILFAGPYDAGGRVRCECPACGGRSLLWWEFERHGGGCDEMPGDRLFLSNGTSLREILLACNTGVASLADSPRLATFWSQLFSGQIRIPTGQSILAIVARYLAELPEHKEDPRMRNLAVKWELFAQKSAVANRKKRKTTKHKRIFLEGILKDGEPVRYQAPQGPVLNTGTVKFPGILCDCCNKIVTCTGFEAHAGRASRRAPYDNIRVSSGLTLRKLAETLPQEPEKNALSEKLHQCASCHGKGGSMIFCEGCQIPHHAACAGVEAHPEAGWLCQKCRTNGVDLALVSELTQVVRQCQALLSELDIVAGGCVLCHCSDFMREGFGPRTILICDQCEREFHVGCLKKHHDICLKSLPDDEWFCGSNCSQVNAALRNTVAVGEQRLLTSASSDVSKIYSCQILRGKGGSHDSAKALAQAMRILKSSFDPLRDLSTGTDLLPLMVEASTFKDQDYRNVHTILLKSRDQPVCAAVLRVFGTSLAELPFIATKREHRRQGHCQILMGAVENLLVALGVKRLCLPAAEEVISTWVDGFGFVEMPDEQVKADRSDMKVLMFPGARLLHKIPIASPACGT